MEEKDDENEDLPQPKIRTKIYRSYDEENLRRAIKAVVDGDMRIAEAAREFFVPRKTLDDRIKGKVSLDARPGRKLNLSRKQEKKLVRFLQYIGKRGYPLNRQKMRPLIRCFARLEGTEIFTSDGPSDQWFRNFHERHPTLRVQGVQRNRGKKSFQDAVLGPWFDLLQKTMSKLDLSLTRIYNCGETTISGIDFDMCQDIQLRGSDRVTCVEAVRADGRRLPTMIVYKDLYPDQSTGDQVPTDWLFASSDSGFLSYETFNQWFEDIFLAAIGPERPALLVLSDTEQHANYTFVEYAKQENVEVVYLPAHIASQVQPLDVNLFANIRRRLLHHAQVHQVVSNGTINRANLAMLWHAGSQDVCTEEAVKNSFLVSGIKSTTKHARDLDDHVSTSARTSGAKSLSHVSPALTPEPGCDGEIQAVDVVPVANVPVPAEMVVISNDTCYGSLDQQTWAEDQVVMTTGASGFDEDFLTRSGATATGSSNSDVLTTSPTPQSQQTFHPKRKKSQTKTLRKRKIQEKPNKLHQNPPRANDQKRKLARKLLHHQQITSSITEGLKITIKKDNPVPGIRCNQDIVGRDPVGPEDADEEVCRQCLRNWPRGQRTRRTLSWTKCSKCCRWFHDKCIELKSKLANFVCFECDDDIS